MTEVRAPNIPVITRFVREVIGCQCPDEVFQWVEVQPGSRAVPNCRADYELRIGGRLLIVVTTAAEELLANSCLAQVITEGKRARDALGFNRFRLVVQSPNPARDKDRLLRAFENVSSRDDKTHLHVVSQSDVPDFLQP